MVVPLLILTRFFLLPVIKSPNNWKSALNSISDAIGNLSNLTELNLISVELDSLPESIQNLQNLVELDLHFNNISELPASMKNLKALQTINLYSNKINTSSFSILCTIPHLRVLNLDDNPIEVFPENLAMLSQLENLTIIRTKLNPLPAWIWSINRA